MCRSYLVSRLCILAPCGRALEREDLQGIPNMEIAVIAPMEASGVQRTPFSSAQLGADVRGLVHQFLVDCVHFNCPPTIDRTGLHIWNHCGSATKEWSARKLNVPHLRGSPEVAAPGKLPNDEKNLTAVRIGRWR